MERIKKNDVIGCFAPIYSARVNESSFIMVLYSKSSNLCIKSQNLRSPETIE